IGKVGQTLGIQLLIYGDAGARNNVSNIVKKVGYQLAKESANNGLEQGLREGEGPKYKKTVGEIKGVIEINELLARMHGRYIVIDIKLSVDPNITVKEGHDIAHYVKATLIDNHQEIEDVLVHINPHFE